jgi:Mycothiol maleylpyruvate isomerase N-terminal domain
MDDPRHAFLEAASSAADLLGRSEVAEQWSEPSVLAEFTTAGLAGHLLRCLRTVEVYLEDPEPDGVATSAAGYYDSIGITDDISSPLNRDVRSRGEEEAAMGSDRVADEARAVVERLADRLATEAIGRRLRVRDGLIITLDEYLRTRIVELVVHTEDVALSVNLPYRIEVAPAVATIVIDTLVDLARLRHGDWAVIRALARRERDVVSALHVL